MNISSSIKNLCPERHHTQTKWGAGGNTGDRNGSASFHRPEQNLNRFYKRGGKFLIPHSSCHKNCIFITVSAGFNMRKFLPKEVIT